MRDQALVFCNQIWSCADNGSVDGSGFVGSWRESPTVEKERTMGSAFWADTATQLGTSARESRMTAIRPLLLTRGWKVIMGNPFKSLSFSHCRVYPPDQALTLCMP